MMPARNSLNGRNEIGRQVTGTSVASFVVREDVHVKEVTPRGTTVNGVDSEYDVRVHQDAWGFVCQVFFRCRPRKMLECHLER